MIINLNRQLKEKELLDPIADFERIIDGRYRPCYISFNVTKGLFVLVLDAQTMTVKYEYVKKYANANDEVSVFKKLAQKKELERLYCKSRSSDSDVYRKQVPNYIACTGELTLDVEQVFDDIFTIQSNTTGNNVYKRFGESADFYANQFEIEIEGKVKKFDKSVIGDELLFLLTRFTREVINDGKVNFTKDMLELKKELVDDLLRVNKSDDIEKLRPQTKNMISCIVMLVLSYRSFKNKTVSLKAARRFQKHGIVNARSRNNART